jgi:hypothetical protein
LDAADVVKVGGAQSLLVDGTLDLVTLKSNGADPKVYLNTPQLIPNSKDYRYFSFRMYTERTWQNVPGGMIVRWIWVQLNNRGEECYRVSHDIPFDVGWQIYSIDLHDVFNGIAEEVAGSCSGLSWHWLDSSPLNKFRLDPNENTLGVPLHQQIDWVRLTQDESVEQGTPFSIRLGLNKNPSEIRSVEFYYTDNPKSPTKHQASEYKSLTNGLHPKGDQVSDLEPQSAEVGQTIQLPLVLRNFIPSDLPGVANEIRFNWDTSAVAPGDYYVCARVNDSFNEAIYCSEAIVEVTAN